MRAQVEKESVKRFWEEAPCGTRDALGEDELARYRELERQRDEREPFIAKFARFEAARGLKVLEVGVGAGTDHLKFARAGAKCTGIDFTKAAIDLTRRRLRAERLDSRLLRADAESLPFPDNRFDVVYSWGVIHHTPDTPRAAREILRVLRPGGRFCVMIYNARSLVAAQAWLMFAALRGRPSESAREVIARHVESPGTKAYTAQEARLLFANAREVHVETIVTPYDLRLGRRTFLPAWTHRLVPSDLGWFHVLSGIR
jgi:ubiquinone/menaquinone biosynthesis C-methylase UbiE